MSYGVGSYDNMTHIKTPVSGVNAHRTLSARASYAATYAVEISRIGEFSFRCEKKIKLLACALTLRFNCLKLVPIAVKALLSRRDDESNKANAEESCDSRLERSNIEESQRRQECYGNDRYKQRKQSNLLRLVLRLALEE